MEIRKFTFRGIEFKFEETKTLDILIKEVFSDNYKVLSRGIQFKKGDVVIDLGANEGLFSIMIAKLFPQVKIVACEPVKRTYDTLVRNIELNGVSIDARMVGVGKIDGHMEMVVSKIYSGGSTTLCTFNPINNYNELVKIVPLDKILNEFKKVRLLKIDIEGMEYDALYASHNIGKIDYVVGEFHMNSTLQKRGRDITELATYVGSKTNLLYYETCKMAD